MIHITCIFKIIFLYISLSYNPSCFILKIASLIENITQLQHQKWKNKRRRPSLTFYVLSALKQFVDKLPINCWVFDHYVGLMFKGLSSFWFWNIFYSLTQTLEEFFNHKSVSFDFSIASSSSSLECCD